MKGLTLVELLMSLIIVSIVMASIYNVLQHSLSAHSHVEAQAEVTQNARMAIERFSKEVRRAMGSADGFNYCNVSEIQFSIDYNENGNNLDDGERIRYRVVGGDLERSDSPAGGLVWRPEVIANYVTGFTMSYRRDNNNILSPLPLSAARRNNIRLINADLALNNIRKGGEDNYPVQLRASIHPRNR